MRNALIFLSVVGLSVAFVAHASGGTRYYSFFDGWPSDSHSLDGVERFVKKKSKRKRALRCKTTELVSYRSKSLNYRARVHRDFAKRLQKFDKLLNQHAIEHFGRPAKRIRHSGGFACRKARGRRGRISEHAFGNAIDISAFEFGRAPKKVAKSLPTSIRRAFTIRIDRHWSPRKRRDARFARFLHSLTEKLKSRPDIFRGIVGPPQKRHHNHLHLDAAPWRYAMFAYSSD